MNNEDILRQRMHGLYLTRSCGDLNDLAHELMGLHSWFSRNVVFSALIRGANTRGWAKALTKTWLYRGTLHGVNDEDLPELLALHASQEPLSELEQEVLRQMEDGVTSRAEFRRIFRDQLSPETLDWVFGPWGGVFVPLARRGRVAFRDMNSHDFDLIDAQPVRTCQEVFPDLVRRYFEVYGPATYDDAAWFFGFWKTDAKRLRLCAGLEALPSFELDGKRYYGWADNAAAEIPELCLLSGFDPLLASYTPPGRRVSLPDEVKSRVVLKSGIILPVILVHGQAAGVWNLKNGEPTTEFFSAQPERLRRMALERVEEIKFRQMMENGGFDL